MDYKNGVYYEETIIGDISEMISYYIENADEINEEYEEYVESYLVEKRSGGKNKNANQQQNSSTAAQQSTPNQSHPQGGIWDVGPTIITKNRNGFMEKFNYRPLSIHGVDSNPAVHGQITVRGRDYYIDMDILSPHMTFPSMENEFCYKMTGKYIKRSTGAVNPESYTFNKKDRNAEQTKKIKEERDAFARRHAGQYIDEPVIMLDQSFFTLPENKLLGILAHEIGHIRLQGKNNTINKDRPANMEKEQIEARKRFGALGKLFIHGNADSEIEADIYAANMVGKKEFLDSLKSFEKIVHGNAFDDIIDAASYDRITERRELIQEFLNKIDDLYVIYINYAKMYNEALEKPDDPNNRLIIKYLGRPLRNFYNLLVMQWSQGAKVRLLTKDEFRSRAKRSLKKENVFKYIFTLFKTLIRLVRLGVRILLDKIEYHVRKRNIQKHMNDAPYKGYESVLLDELEIDDALLTEAKKSTKPKASKSEEVRDVEFNELPEELKNRLVEINRIISSYAKEEFGKKTYSYLNTQQWAKTWMDEFLTVPGGRSRVGSTRLYKKGNRYRCMIQITGHVDNSRNTEDEEFFHGLIRNIHTGVRSRIRRKFDVTLTCESEHGEPYEGFDVWLKQKEAKALWELFNDKTTKKITPAYESYRIYAYDDLPAGLQDFLEETSDMLTLKLYNYGVGDLDNVNSKGHTILYHENGEYSGYINVGIESSYEEYCPACEKIIEEVGDRFENSNPSKSLVLVEESGPFFEISLSPEYSEYLWKYMENSDLVEVAYLDNIYTEAAPTKDFSEAKAAIRSISEKELANINKKNYAMSPNTAKIYSSLVTTHLMKKWGNGYNRLALTLDEKCNGAEFITPRITPDFVGRFLNGREALNGFLHRDPVIKLRANPRIFRTMTEADQPFEFFKAAIKFYASTLNSYGDKLRTTLLRLSKPLKELIATTSLSGVVTVSIKMLCTFDKVDLSEPKSLFKISNRDFHAIQSFISSIEETYVNPAKQKKVIVRDLSRLGKSFQESCGYDQTVSDVYRLAEAVDQLIDGKFDDEIDQIKQNTLHEYVDTTWPNSAKDPQVRYVAEKFGVKKLKKIPPNVIAYISIETDAIRDNNDKFMIASYCISKLEQVDWYIELITSDNKKYEVPHSLAYLQTLKTQLLACYKNIMNHQVPDPMKKPVIDVQYPEY